MIKVCSKMGLPQWLSRLKSFNSASENSSQLENGTELANVGPELHRSEQIMNEINEGSYTCSICTEPVLKTHIDQFKFWHCTECHNICHFLCIKRIDTSDSENWRCLICRAYQPRVTTAKCWCGGLSYGCLGRCMRRLSCSHGTKVCPKPCHPGPCQSICRNGCSGVPVSTPRVLTSWDRVRGRWRRSNKKDAWIFAINTLLLTVLYGFLAVFAAYHVRWRTRPDLYPSFAADHESDEFMGIIMGGMFFLLPASIALLKMIRSSFYRLTSELFNLKDSTTNEGKKMLIEIFRFVASVLTPVGLLIYLIVGFGVLPGVVWEHNMKDSCNGFNLRVDMDSGARFHIHTYKPQARDQQLYTAARLRPVHNSDEPFQYFHRISSNTTAVDVDLKNSVSRQLRLNDSDTANAWLGWGFEHGSNLPQFSPIEEILLNNGTFTSVDHNHTHMHIPELDISMQNMYNFLKHNSTQPFLRVYNTQGLNEEEKNEMLKKVWSPKSDPRVVMRTATFGQESIRLDMCMRDYRVAQGHTTSYFLEKEEREFVALAIIKTLRASAKDCNEGVCKNL